MRCLLFILLGLNFVFGQFAGGTGAINDPYLISNATQLNNMRSYPSKHFKLLNDINLNELTMTANGNWIPIPSDNSKWWALDGNGKTIRNMVVKNRPVSAKKYGLFEYLGLYDGSATPGTAEAVVKNLRIAKAVLIDSSNTTSPSNPVFMGVLASEIYSTSPGTKYSLNTITIDSCKIKMYRTVDMYGEQFFGLFAGSLSNVRANRLAVLNSDINVHINRQAYLGAHVGVFVGKMSCATSQVIYPNTLYGFNQSYSHDCKITIGGGENGGVLRHGGFFGTEASQSGGVESSYINRLKYYNNTTTNAHLFSYLSSITNLDCSDLLFAKIRFVYTNIKYIPFNGDYTKVAFVNHNAYKGSIIQKPDLSVSPTFSKFYNIDSCGNAKGYSSRANAYLCTTGDTAIGKTTVQMKDFGTYSTAYYDIIEPNPNRIWGIDDIYNSGMPFLRWTNPVLSSVNFIEPLDESYFTYPDTVRFKWTARGDSVFVLKFTATDSVIVNNDTTYNYIIPNIGGNLNVKLYLYNKPSILTYKSIAIYPDKYLAIDTVVTKGKLPNGSDLIGIVVKSVGVEGGRFYVDKDNIWYRVGTKKFKNVGDVSPDTLIVSTGLVINKKFRVIEDVDTLGVGNFQIELIDTANIMPWVGVCNRAQWNSIWFDDYSNPIEIPPILRGYKMTFGAYIIDQSCGWAPAFREWIMGQVYLRVDSTGGKIKIRKDDFRFNYVTGMKIYPYEQCAVFNGTSTGETNNGSSVNMYYKGLELFTMSGIKYDNIIKARIPNFFGYDTTVAFVWNRGFSLTDYGNIGGELTMSYITSRYFWIFVNRSVIKTAILARLPNLVPRYQIMHDDYELTTALKTNKYRNYFRGIHPKIYKYGKLNGVL